MKIHLEMELPDTLLEPFVQSLRDFEQKHPADALVNMWFTDLKITAAQVQAIFDRLRPPLPYHERLTLN